MTKRLSMESIKKLLKAPEKTDDKMYKERWPGEENKIKLAKAVDREADFVLFTNGDRFSIEYHDTNVLIRLSTGEFCPMGWFSRKELTEAKQFEKVSV